MVAGMHATGHGGLHEAEPAGRGPPKHEEPCVRHACPSCGHAWAHEAPIRYACRPVWPACARAQTASVSSAPLPPA
jgi:hypothetical protein